MDERLTPALRGLGWCAIGAAVTTLLNTTLPFFYSAEGFEARAALIGEPLYVFRQWVLLAHPGFTLLLALGVALALKARAPGRAATGLLFAGIEKMTEFLMGTIILFTVNSLWKPGYLAAVGTPAANAFRTRIEIFGEVIDSLYFLLWAMFVLSTAAFASALPRTTAIERGVVATAVLTIALTLLMMLGDYAGQSAWTGPVVAWAYPPALTLHRLVVGLWLFETATAAARTSG